MTAPDLKVPHYPHDSPRAEFQFTRAPLDRVMVNFDQPACRSLDDPKRSRRRLPSEAHNPPFYTAPDSEGTIVVRRAFGTTAEITILDPASRCAELKMLVEIAEALRAQGFSPDRRPYDVRVCWDVPGAARRAA